jgi:cytochrome P450
MSEMDPARHIHKQKNIASAFLTSSILKSEASVDEAVRQFSQKLAECSDSGSIMDFRPWCLYYGFDVIGRVTFSKPFGLLEEGRDIGNSIVIGEYLERYLGIMGHFPWLNSLVMDNPIMLWLGVQPWNHLINLTLQTIKDRTSDSKAKDDMIDHWISTYRRHPERMEEKEIQDAVTNNLGAGAGSVGTALQAFIHCAAKDRSRLERLQHEFDSATVSNELDSVPSWAQVNKLPYLKAGVSAAGIICFSSDTDCQIVD